MAMQERVQLVWERQRAATGTTAALAQALAQITPTPAVMDALAQAATTAQTTRVLAQVLFSRVAGFLGWSTCH